MQRLTYINLNNEKVEFFLEPYILSHIDGVGYSELEMLALRGAYQQGDTLTGCRRTYRNVDITVNIRGASREDLYNKRSNMLGVLSPDKSYDGVNRARIIYENDAGRYWTWAIISEYTPGKRFLDYIKDAQLTFRCESPYWYAAAQSEAEFSYSGDGFTLPFAFPVRFGTMNFSREINNLGHVRAFPEVRIYGMGETPTLYNRSTGAVIALRSALPEGSVLYLNTDPARLEASVTDAQGARTNAFGQLDISHPLTDFWLRPGLNRLEYDAGGAGTQSVIKVNWYAAYEGV